MDTLYDFRNKLDDAKIKYDILKCTDPNTQKVVEAVDLKLYSKVVGENIRIIVRRNRDLVTIMFSGFSVPNGISNKDIERVNALNGLCKYFTLIYQEERIILKACVFLNNDDGNDIIEVISGGLNTIEHLYPAFQ